MALGNSPWSLLWFGQHQEHAGTGPWAVGRGTWLHRKIHSSAARNDAPFKPIERLHASFCHGNGDHFDLLWRLPSCYYAVTIIMPCRILFQELWTHWIALRLCRSNPRVDLLPMVDVMVYGGK